MTTSNGPDKTVTTADTKAKTDAPASTAATLPGAETSKPTQVTTNPASAAVTPAVTVTAAAKSTDKPAATQPSAATTQPSAATTQPSAAATQPSAAMTQPSAATVPNNQPTASTINLSAASTTQLNKINPVTVNPSPSKTLNSAATTDSSSGGSVVSSSAPIIQTTKPSVSSVVLASTGSPVTQPGGQGNVGTTKPTKISTDAPDPGQPSTSHTTITSKTSQQGGQGGSEKTTMTISYQQLTESKAPGPAGNTGTTSSPSTLTKAGPLAGGTSGTRAGTTDPQIPTTSATTSGAQLKTFVYSLNTGQEKDEKHEMVEVCKRLMVNLQDGNCTLTWRHHNDKVQFDCVEINGKVKTNLATQIYEEINKKPTDNKTLIAILASCGALLIMIVILAVCASHHRKPYNENQQHLTEELHTVENGYHDNPTLEVMEVQPEMQEKKMALNGEFNDSWIVPMDNLLKDDIPDEEDTHL
ncbi:podocalyxin [Tautogolabrus adspersus]